MTAHALRLDSIFGALADPTRRDILKRVGKKELTVNEIARPYRLSLAAVSKHLHVLERAKLVLKRRQGRQQVVSLSSTALRDAAIYLHQYEAQWNDRFDALDRYLKNTK